MATLNPLLIPELRQAIFLLITSTQDRKCCALVCKAFALDMRVHIFRSLQVSTIKGNHWIQNARIPLPTTTALLLALSPSDVARHMQQLQELAQLFQLYRIYLQQQHLQPVNQELQESQQDLLIQLLQPLASLQLQQLQDHQLDQLGQLQKQQYRLHFGYNHFDFIQQRAHLIHSVSFRARDASILVAAGCKNLFKISAGGDMVPAMEIIPLVVSNPRLKELSIGIPKQSVPTLIFRHLEQGIRGHCQALEKIKLRGVAISAWSYDMLLLSCPNLNSFSVDGFRLVRQEETTPVQDFRHPKLQKISLTGFKGADRVTTSSLDHFVRRSADLQKVRLDLLDTLAVDSIHHYFSGTEKPGQIKSLHMNRPYSLDWLTSRIWASLPGLHEIGLEGWPERYTRQAWTNHYATLTRISIRYSIMDKTWEGGEFAATILASCPRLQKANFEFEMNGNALARGTTWVCAGLKELSLRFSLNPPTPLSTFESLTLAGYTIHDVAEVGLFQYDTCYKVYQRIAQLVHLKVLDLAGRFPSGTDFIQPKAGQGFEKLQALKDLESLTICRTNPWVNAVTVDWINTNWKKLERIKVVGGSAQDNARMKKLLPHLRVD